MTNITEDEVMEAFYRDFGESPHYDDKIAVANVLKRLADYARDGCGMLHACELLDIADKLEEL